MDWSGLVVDLASLRGVLATLATYGAQGGAFEKGVPPDQQLTNEVMFAAIRGGLKHVPKLASSAEEYEEALRQLDAAESAFAAGDNQRAEVILYTLRNDWCYPAPRGKKSVPRRTR